MRDRVMKLLEVTGKNLDTNIAALMTQFTAQFETVHGPELPEPVKQALAALEQSLRDKREMIEAKIVDAHLAFLLPEDIEGLITWHESELGKKADRVSGEINAQMDDAAFQWIREAQKSVEPTWRKLLGDETVEAQQAQELPTVPETPNTAA